MPRLAQSGAQSMDGLMEQRSKVVHIAIYSISYKADGSSVKRKLGLTISRPGDNWGEICMATSPLPSLGSP